MSEPLAPEDFPGPHELPFLGNVRAIDLAQPIESLSILAEGPVDAGLIQVFRMKSGVSTDGNTWLARLRADGRFLEDIWGG
jgi:hypothetical protein